MPGIDLRVVPGRGVDVELFIFEKIVDAFLEIIFLRFGASNCAPGRIA
jgi:hypothetical protein